MNQLGQQLAERILVLDGAMGTMIQKANLSEKEYRGERFCNHPTPLYGNNDILCLTNPDLIKRIYRAYLDAGADIISTNSFNANAISQTDYSTQHLIEEINKAAARLAREEADRFMEKHPEKKIFVAGSVGPTNRSASISPRVDDPAFRNVDFDELLAAYRQQISALVAGDIDIILFETVFDTLNLKAGLEAARQIAAEKNIEIPVMVSATVAGPSGRILSGQTLSALWTSISSYENIVSFGLNCSWGAREMIPYIEEISSLTDRAVSCYPNAGLPDEDGRYTEPVEEFADAVKALMQTGIVNIVGGCCGTTPTHISMLAKAASEYPPRKAPLIGSQLRLAGLETLAVTPENNFVNIGERCNVAGSRKFLRLIKEGAYDEALTIARRQVEDGAQIIDINMDDSMIDAREQMIHFLRLIASDPDVARVPVMIDSSDWSVLEAGLKCVQGKCIVNSISLKEGEEEFLRRARIIRSFGAAVVVMAFDEKGQADTFERKIEICTRAYRILTDVAGFNPVDIIFDPNIMAVATGIEEHDFYGRDYINAVRWIKENLPGAKTSGGVSNLSFAFRGHNRLRESMHAVFLYHAITAGLDMAIVNPSSTVTYEDVAPELRQILDNLFLNGSHEAAENLSAYAERAETTSPDAKATEHNDRSSIPVSDRLRDALIKGNDEYLADDIAEALVGFKRAIDIIEGPLMDGVSQVGTLFGDGKMFLPQVVKTARVMKHAVELLKPSIEAEKSEAENTSAGTILFATVKGDVHDIGKNIVSIVLECNNYKVIDLGVMVPAETIVDAAIQYKPDIICLSGLITPSLAEMANVADKLESAGLNIPLMVGGATTSKIYTALKLANRLSAPVVHAEDAAQNPLLAAQLLNPERREEFVRALNAEYDSIRLSHEAKKTDSLLPLTDARERRFMTDWNSYVPTVPVDSQIRVQTDIPLDEVIGYINWRLFFHFWKITGEFIEDFPYDGCQHCVNSWKIRHAANPKAIEALKLYNDARAILAEIKSNETEIIKSISGIFKAYSDGNDNIIIDDIVFPMLRRQIPNSDNICLSLADFVMPEEFTSDERHDYVGAFVVTASANNLIARYEENGDRYSMLLLRSVLDRLAEAGSEYLHRYVRTRQWGYADDENYSTAEIFAGKYRGIRPAMGYPMTPDQLMNLCVAELLPFDNIGVSLTENGAMHPPSSVSGLYIAHPEAKYFMIGQIDREQLEDYASRRGLQTEIVEPILNKNI
ncbi:MAG: methionine synthase [Muribaculaceae bacterium]|nr:methionine synthase [Muribaculaceae bacterium]